jgi:hypothetical protein
LEVITIAVVEPLLVLLVLLVVVGVVEVLLDVAVEDVKEEVVDVGWVACVVVDGVDEVAGVVLVLEGVVDVLLGLELKVEDVVL